MNCFTLGAYLTAMLFHISIKSNHILLISEDPEGELWHSTAIVSRVNAKLLQTKSGSQYRLVGPINETVTLQQGIYFAQYFTKNILFLLYKH